MKEGVVTQYWFEPHTSFGNVLLVCGSRFTARLETSLFRDLALSLRGPTDRRKPNMLNFKDAQNVGRYLLDRVVQYQGGIAWKVVEDEESQPVRSRSSKASGCKSTGSRVSNAKCRCQQSDSSSKRRSSTGGSRKRHSKRNRGQPIQAEPTELPND